MRTFEQNTVAIIGQGYVGLPLALAAAQAGFNVIGVDRNSSLVSKLQTSFSEGKYTSKTTLVNHSIKYRATTDISEISKADVVVLCLPTPLDDSGHPDPSDLLSGAESAARHIPSGALLINESTVAPGFTIETLGLIFPGYDLAFSPERIDPGNKSWNIENTPKLLAANSDIALKRAHNFYSKFVKEVICFSSVEVCEAAKLLENSFRLINISFINEFADFCRKMGIDVNEVIRAASTKPHGFMAFNPSLGVGGHCIPVDPIYLSTKAREVGAKLRFIDLAFEVNQSLPKYFTNMAAQMLDGLSGKKILVVGIAYKPDVSDIRESRSIALIKELRARGADVAWHDELVKNWNSETSSPLDSNSDLIVLAQVHHGVDLSTIIGTKILDTRR
jgi:UDP-N-acetyl-D-glucosamine dehydrogenase